MVRLRVLGPLGAEVGGAPVDLGGRRQRSVLALLLTRRGGVVSVDRMIEHLWRYEPPPRAIASLQAYVSHLRRLLEPDRPPRAAASVLVSAAPGYALRLSEDAVDAWRFESLLAQAQAAAPEAPSSARRLLDEALGLWRGPAYAEVADEEWAVTEVARLTELHVVASELSVEMALRAGSPAQAVAPAEVLVREHPLRESGWRLLALALWGSGRQGDALAALRRARDTVRDELGLDPGPGLTELETAILAQRQDVLDRVVTPAPAAPIVTPAPPAQADRGEPFVGREAELAAFTDAAGAARTAGRVVLVSGEPGIGKSSLLGQVRQCLAATGWTVVLGRCPEHDGAPPAWAWVEALRGLAAEQAPHSGADALAPLLADKDPEVPAEGATGRFRLHRAVASWLREASASRPLAVFLDDLHRGDGETLALLESIATELAGAPVLFTLAYRPAEVGERLEQTLAVLARLSPYRLPLAGLQPSDVDELVRQVCGGPVDLATLRALADRTGGNPFYATESARLLSSEGALIARSEVPEGVRDVLRRRLARLPGPAVAVLRLAAAAGREADVDVLVTAAETDEAGVLDGLEAGVIAGLLTEPAPGRVRFAHAIVRDTMYTDLTQLRRTRMHARLADAIRQLHPDDLSALAYHYAHAGSAQTAPLALEYALRAAELAERRYAYDSAVALLRQAVEAFERTGSGAGDRDGQRVDLLGRLLRAQVRAGAVAAARETRAAALSAAQRAGRQDLTIAAFTAWTVATPWETHPYGMVDVPVVQTLERLLDRADLDPVTRCRLLDAYVSEVSGEDGARAVDRATEQLLLAREQEIPDLVCAGLASNLKVLDVESAARRRLAVAAELLELSERCDAPPYRWLAEHSLGGVAAASNDVAELRRRLAEGLRTARQYQMAEPEAVSLCTAAMLAHVEGRFAEAESGYAEVLERMLRHGALHGAGFHVLALATVRLSEGRISEMELRLRELFEQYGPQAGDLWAVALCAAGRLDEARGVHRGTPWPRLDYFFTLFATFRAATVVALGERDEAARLVDALLPRREHLAGAASTALASRPVAHTLGELYEFLGRPDEAAAQFARAEQVAEQWGSAHWARAARAGLARNGRAGK